jgi:hypothetical protein
MHNSGISQSKEYNSMKRKKQINIKKRKKENELFSRDRKSVSSDGWCFYCGCAVFWWLILCVNKPF